MKKLLLLLFSIFLSLQVFSQASIRENVPELIERAQGMFQDDPSSSEGRKYLRIALESEPGNEEVNYLLAKSHLNDAPSQYVLNYIGKAIQADPTNMEYRWIRVQSLMAQMKMLQGTRLEMIDETFQDLDFLIAKESDIGKAYLIKAYLYDDLGDEWKFKVAKEASNQVSNYKTANAYYQKSLDAFHKSVGINVKYQEGLDSKAIEFKMKQTNSKLAEF